MPEVVEPVNTADANDETPPTHTAAYANDIESLKSLELSCERDEINWFSKIRSLQLAVDDGADVTAAIYAETPDMDLGELIFENYETDVDVQSLKAIHKALGEPIKGAAYVKGKSVKVLIFRG